MLADPSRCQVLLVTTPEETPVSETIETAQLLEEKAGTKLGGVVVNGLLPVLALPPVIEPEELGRVSRQTEGDANNDGYNERRGAYQLIANESRLEVTFSPRSSALLRPVLEITGLPAGDVLVTVEGKLIEKTTRLSDGTLLVLVPTKIDRTTTISVRVQ